MIDVGRIQEIATGLTDASTLASASRGCDIIETFDDPNQKRYPGQQIHAIGVEGYVYLVPFVESEEEVFLKTIIPSRKATKKYGGTGDE